MNYNSTKSIKIYFLRICKDGKLLGVFCQRLQKIAFQRNLIFRTFSQYR